MTKELLDKIYKETLKKPELYHYVCYGGASCEMINTYSDKNNYKCQHQGVKNWMTPVCEKCTGLKAKELSLTGYETNINSGITKLYNAILNKIEL